MSHKGQLYGFFYDYALQPEDTEFRFGLEGEAAFGSHLHYHSKNTGDAKNVRYRVLEGRALTAYATPFCNQWILEGYLGLGIRYLSNTSGISTSGHYGYLRISQYNYVPIGIRVINERDNAAKWIASLEYDWFLSGLQKSYLYRMTLKNRQTRGYGARASLDFHIPSCSCDYIIGIFARYWKVQDSKPDQGWLEPKNNTKELGVRVGMEFL
jgi:hypothetical protein